MDYFLRSNLPMRHFTHTAQANAANLELRPQICSRAPECRWDSHYFRLRQSRLGSAGGRTQPRDRLPCNCANALEFLDLGALVQLLGQIAAELLGPLFCQVFLERGAHRGVGVLARGSALDQAEERIIVA